MSNYKLLKNIVYSKTVRENLTADLYLPSGKKSDIPVVIAVHGGAFQAGAKEMYDAWGPYLASNDIALMSVNYRLATPYQKSYPEVLEDMFAAINYIIEKSHEFGLEPTKIGFMGDSAGAYLGAMAAFTSGIASASIRFVVSAYGVLDIADWAEYTNGTRDDYVINKMFGADPFTAYERYKAACPMNLIDYAARDHLFSTMFMMIWGEDDDVVLPENQTLAFIKKLDKYGVYHEDIAVPGHGHFWFTKNDSSDNNEMIPLLKQDIAPRVLAFINGAVNKTFVSDPASKE